MIWVYFYTGTWMAETLFFRILNSGNLTSWKSFSLTSSQNLQNLVISLTIQQFFASTSQDVKLRLKCPLFMILQDSGWFCKSFSEAASGFASPQITSKDKWQNTVNAVYIYMQVRWPLYINECQATSTMSWTRYTKTWGSNFETAE